ncbi:MAG: DNA polymerase IV [Sphingobacteriales bacterium]|nr:MAG: DNA polymerase IV [Sphingobacteriales bacterium]
MPDSNTPQRKIIHVDMDAFYASVEQRDNPEYRGKAIAVGGLPQGRGVVATASYEARKFGVRSAMSSRRALELCPDIIFVRPRFDVYKEVSQHIRSIFQRYTDKIEPLSLDEAFLDVTIDKKDLGSAIDIANEIKQAIKDELNLTASAGISINKFIAKIASDMNKPDGLMFIGPSSVENFMEQLPVEKFYGVGKVTADKMKSMGLHNGADLKNLSHDEMVDHFGKAGHFYFNIVRGVDNREVQTEREIKSVGAEDTFAYDLTDVNEMNAELEKIAQLVYNRMQRYELKGRTIMLKIKYHDFKLITRSQSFLFPTNDVNTIAETAKMLLEQSDLTLKKIRLLGITLSNFGEITQKERRRENPGQLKLFDV